MIYLRNGNVIKFSQTNQKHFSIGVAMANPTVKIGKPPLPLARHGAPSNTLMPRPTQRTTPNRGTDGSLTHFRTAISQTPHWLQWRAPYSPPKLPLPRPIPKSNYLRNPWTHPIYTIPNRIRIRPAVLPQCTGLVWTDRQTDRHTHRPTGVGGNVR